MTGDIKKVPLMLKQTLRSLRVRSDLNQEEAAKLLNISVSKLRRWEEDSSNLSYRDIELIEQRYSIPQDYIFFGNNHAFSEKMKLEQEV